MDSLPKPEPVQGPDAQTQGQGPLPGAQTSSVMSLPSSVALRFEFNATTQGWVIALTDSDYGEVVRKIALKDFSRSTSAAQRRALLGT
jgi:hypothetical protein